MTRTGYAQMAFADVGVRTYRMVWNDGTNGWARTKARYDAIDEIMWKAFMEARIVTVMLEEHTDDPMPVVVSVEVGDVREIKEILAHPPLVR